MKLVAKTTQTFVDPEQAEEIATKVSWEKVEVLAKVQGQETADEWCRNEAEKHLLNLKAYYRVASRRIMEIVPMKIQFSMLRQLSANIQTEVTK